MNLDSIDYGAFVRSLGPQLAAYQSHAESAQPGSARSGRPRTVPGQQPHGGVDAAPNSNGAPYLEPQPAPCGEEGRRTYGRHTPGIYTSFDAAAADAGRPLTEHDAYAFAAGLEGGRIANYKTRVPHKAPSSWAGLGAPPPPGLAGRHVPHGEVQLPGGGGTGRRPHAEEHEGWMSADVVRGMRDPAPGRAAQRGMAPQLPHMRAQVDEIVFGHDADGSARALPLAASAAFAGAAGVDTTRLGGITASSHDPRPPPPHQRTQVWPLQNIRSL